MTENDLRSAADNSGKLIFAPFTDEQVVQLNRYQTAGRMHPFTCGGEQHHGGPTLTATPEGWVCPDQACTYTQNWAHAFMADKDAVDSLCAPLRFPGAAGSPPQNPPTA
jgi:hypothetical protein